MGRTGGVIGALKEHQIARSDIGGGHPRTELAQSLRAQPAEAPAHAAVVVDIADKAGAVEGGGGRTAAPDVGVGNPLMLSPDFPPLHTVHATFTAHGVPSLVILTIYYNLPCSFLGVVFPEFLLNLLSGAERSAFPFASY